MLCLCFIMTFDVTHPISLNDGCRSKAEAIVLPKITTKLIVLPIKFKAKWKHLSGLQLANPDLEVPTYVDVLLGSMFSGSSASKPAVRPIWFSGSIEHLLWVGSVGIIRHEYLWQQIVSYVTTSTMCNEMLQKFWKIENGDFLSPLCLLEKRQWWATFMPTFAVDEEGRFIVPLPKKAMTDPLGESRSITIQRLISLEC